MTGTEAEVEAGHHPPSAMTGTVAEGLAPPPVMSEGAGGRAAACGLVCDVEPGGAQARGRRPLPPFPAEPRPPAPPPPGSGI